MKNRFLNVVLLCVLLLYLSSNVQAKTKTPTNQPALVYIELSSSDDLTRFATTQLPMYALLEHGLLTGADRTGQRALREAGLSIQVLDAADLSASYYLAASHPGRPVPDFASFGQVLLHTNNGVLLRMEPSQVDALVNAGAELQYITLTPKSLPTTQSGGVFPNVVQPDPIIQGMIDQVTELHVSTYDRQLAGEVVVPVDGSWYLISSRYTYSVTPIQKTTHFVGQHMQGLGMNVEYHQWGGTGGATYPNVIGEIPGTVDPEDIYIIGAHIDDVSNTKGADDNASGSVATLLAADILSQHKWGCTLRFAFWTGEEQGLLGSAAYAQRAYQQNENILGYLNLDMIAYNTSGSLPGIDVIYNPVMPATYALAQLFAGVIDAYNINLIPGLGTSLGGGSDHSSFWNNDYPAILSIEDQSDFNPYYHSPNDTPAHTDLTYFTNFVKASVGTFAHMSGCLIPEGHINGHVTTAVDGSPIDGAKVTAYNLRGDDYPSTTDASGYYTLTLPVDTYTVTASAAGYLMSGVSGVEVITNTTTSLDFTLHPGCDPVSGLNFTWEPPAPSTGDQVTFTATTNGTEPIDFQWSFGDTFIGTGTLVYHSYADPGTFAVDLSADNACSNESISKDLTIMPRIWKYFFPYLNK